MKRFGTISGDSGFTWFTIARLRLFGYGVVIGIGVGIVGFPISHGVTPGANRTVHLKNEAYSLFGQTHLDTEVAFSFCVIVMNKYP